MGCAGKQQILFKLCTTLLESFHKKCQQQRLVQLQQTLHTQVSTKSRAEQSRAHKKIFNLPLGNTKLHMCVKATTELKVRAVTH